jgi:hypothetical protein
MKWTRCCADVGCEAETPRTNMAFSVCVEPAGWRGTQLGQSLEMEDVVRRQLFHRPLGAGADIHDFWHLPALKLELKLLARIYHEGLGLTGESLLQLENELNQLERHWRTTCTVEELMRLHERFSYLHAAIQIARHYDGELFVC